MIPKMDKTLMQYSPAFTPTLVALLMLALLLFGGCAGSTVLEVGIGPEIKNAPWQSKESWKGSGGVVDLRVRRISEDGNWYCEVAHTSNLTSGPPFNNDDDTSVDRISCGGRLVL